MRGFAPLLKLMLAWALALVTALASAAGLGSLLGGRSTELLPPDEAYRLEMRVVDARTLAATLTPAPDYYLYRDRIHFTVEDPPGVVVEDVSLPKGEPKQDPTFGQVDVYHHPIEAVIRLSAPVTGPVRVHATYQGCNEPKGVCYPPIEKTLTLTPPGSAVSPAAASATPATLDHSETGRIRSLFGQGTPALLAAFFGFGVLLAFTPCMLPMIPILSGIVVGQARHASKGRALLLSAAYVLGMALTYAAAGVAAGLSGAMLAASLQSPPVLFGFAALFVALSLAMFGAWNLQLPPSLQGRITAVTQRIPGGQVASVFLMGGVSALIVGPCVAAPLAGALLYIGQTRDAALGGMALFSLALGMGLPLLAIGAGAGPLLRRLGPWMVSIQRLFGVGMLALAIYIVSPVTSVAVQQLLWATLLIVSAMSVHAIDPLPADSPSSRRLLKGVGFIALVIGAGLLVGALAGSPDLLQPLASLRTAPSTAAPATVAWQPVRSVADLDAKLRAANGREVMLDFWAEWCVSCKEMDRFTFTDPRVQARLRTVLLLRADVTANSADDQALLRRFSLFGPPGTIFFDGRGREQAERVIGYEPPDAFLVSLERALPRISSTSQRSSP